MAKSSSGSGGRPTPTASPAVPDSLKDTEAQNREAVGAKTSNLTAACLTTTSHAATSVAPPQEDNNDDWCAVCHDGGELLCCGSCPKVNLMLSLKYIPLAMSLFVIQLRLVALFI